jgi:hypothetical protein
MRKFRFRAIAQIKISTVETAIPLQSFSSWAKFLIPERISCRIKPIILARPSPAHSPARSPTLAFVVVLLVIFDSTEQRTNSLLLPPTDVLIQGGGNGFLLGSVTSQFPCLVNQAVIEG